MLLSSLFTYATQLVNIFANIAQLLSASVPGLVNL